MAHFLVVDDEAPLLKQMTALFERAKHTVTTVSDGAEVMKAMGLDGGQGAMPDLVILDVMMPKENGYKVCARLKDDPRTAGIPVVLLTGYTDFTDAFKKFPNVVACLEKPFEPPELLNAVADALFASRSKQAAA